MQIDISKDTMEELKSITKEVRKKYGLAHLTFNDIAEEMINEQIKQIKKLLGE